MTGIIPCLYNSFSFTLENILGGDIVCYEIKNARVTCEELVVPSLPSVLPEPMFSKKCLLLVTTTTKVKATATHRLCTVRRRRRRRRRRLQKPKHQLWFLYLSLTLIV
jgi:hypothetical protein